MQTTTNNTGNDRLEGLWKQVSKGCLVTPFSDTGASPTWPASNGNRGSAKDDRPRRKKSTRSNLPRRGYRYEGLASNRHVRCYADKPYSPHRPRPVSPELQKFWDDEAALAEMDIFGIMRNDE